METLAAADWSSTLQTLLNILYVAIGLGLVIFFHELGHFAVAKWCGVLVERFSIGFGPILWSRKKGETEYALSLIPFGGYVKMFGQDDLDPSQLTSEEIAQDPRAYSSKPVSRRMAIISAGVLMNLLTGILFFVFAFQLGVAVSPPVVGDLQVGMPAWRAGLELGDRIVEINGRPISSFSDIMRGVALTTGRVRLKIVRPDGREFEKCLIPEMAATRRMVGIAPIEAPQLIDFPGEDIPPVFPATAAAKAVPPFESGDRILKIDGRSVQSVRDLRAIFAEKRSRDVTVLVRRKGQSSPVEIHVPPQPVRSLGLVMDIEPIVAIKEGSPADQAGLKVGDKILRINGQEVGREINPLRLPDVLASLHGQNVKIEVKRVIEGGTTAELTLYVVPEDRPGWTEKPFAPGVPMSVPAIGVAFHLIPTVLRVEPGSPAEGRLQAGDLIKMVELVLPPEAPADGLSEKREPITIPINEQQKNWAFAFWMMQVAAARDVRLTVSREGKEEQIELTPQPADDWFLPSRGLRLDLETVQLKSSSLLGAFSLALRHTKNSLQDIYLTLRNLLVGLLSYKELHGPIGIARVAYEVSKEGISKLLLFLGFLSINLAVLNFLPIPVLDGGHMLFLIWEGVTRRRPSERVMIAATYFGMAVVLALVLLVIYLDIFVHGLAGE